MPKMTANYIYKPKKSQVTTTTRGIRFLRSTNRILTNPEWMMNLTKSPFKWSIWKMFRKKIYKRLEKLENHLDNLEREIKRLRFDHFLHSTVSKQYPYKLVCSDLSNEKELLAEGYTLVEMHIDEYGFKYKIFLKKDAT